MCVLKAGVELSAIYAVLNETLFHSWARKGRGRRLRSTLSRPGHWPETLHKRGVLGPERGAEIFPSSMEKQAV